MQAGSWGWHLLGGMGGGWWWRQSLGQRLQAQEAAPWMGAEPGVRRADRCGILQGWGGGQHGNGRKET